MPTRITWLGHSTVLIDLDGVRLLTDPVLRTRFIHLRRVGTATDAAAIGPLDAVLLSHLHHDHADVPTLRRLGRDRRLVVPAGGARLLRRKGFDHVEELGRGDELVIGDVAIRATHAEHHGRRAPFGDHAPAVGYLIEGSSRVYFAGDTDLFDEMSALATAIDVALLPVAGWGFRVPAGHLDPERAAEAAVRLKPRYAIPIHWGTYRPVGFASGRSVRRAPEEFERRAAAVAPSVIVRLLDVGQSFEVPVTPIEARPAGATS